MNTPRFTAEASLYTPSLSYKAERNTSDYRNEMVVPALPIRNVCSAVCCVAIKGKVYCYPCAVLC